MGKLKSKRNQPRKKPISDVIDQRSPNDRSSGGYDSEDYHADGPVPVGNAPIHRSQATLGGIPAGVSASIPPSGNPGDVPNTDGTALNELLAARRETSAGHRHNIRDAEPRLEDRMNHNAQMQECLQNCQACHAVCTETAQHCLQKGGRHAQADHIRLLLDCAEICQTSANYMLRKSPHHARTCGLCAEICQKCAEDCERIAEGDTMMTKCVEICRRCAESCRQMAAMPMAA